MPIMKKLSNIKDPQMSWCAFGVLNAIQYLDHLDNEQMIEVSGDDLTGYFLGLGELFATERLTLSLSIDFEDGETVTESKSYEKERKSGYVYLLKSENGLYKIGRSKDPKSRLNALCKEFPIKIDLVHYFFAQDYIEREKDIHFLFDDKRQGGEWFALEPEDVAYFKELKDELPLT